MTYKIKNKRGKEKVERYYKVKKIKKRLKAFVYIIEEDRTEKPIKYYLQYYDKKGNLIGEEALGTKLPKSLRKVPREILQ